MYDLIKWCVPILNRLPKDHKFTLGNRIFNKLYDFLEKLIQPKYEKKKLARLESLNFELDFICYQTMLLPDFA